ncbi:MAG: sensor histidine kinase [Bacteroidia bacterium]
MFRRWLIFAFLLTFCLVAIAREQKPYFLSGPEASVEISEFQYEKTGARSEEFHFHVINQSGKSLEKILYLHDIQEAEVYLENEAGGPKLVGSTGILKPIDSRDIYKGLVIPGYGYSAQVAVIFPPGKNSISIRGNNMIPKAVMPSLRLYSPGHWSSLRAEDFAQKVAFHLLIVGGMLIMALYHLLVFVQRRDPAFFWYALYAIAISFMLMVESGIFQIYITPQFPKVNYLYRHLQPHALLGYTIYWLFLRSFVNLKKLLPWLDRMILRFLAGFAIATFFLWFFYAQNALGDNYSDIVWVTYALPISALVFGIWAYFPLIRTGDKLVKIFILGSLILLLGVLVNTLISAGIEFGWMGELSFPHFLITEIAVIIEILFFALALGYRFQQLDFERRRMAELDSMKSKFFANISHEFRTPLTIISGIAGKLKGNAEEAELIRRNSDSLLSLVNRLLDLSKLDAGQLRMENITADIVVFLRYLVESFYSLAESKSLELKFESSEEKLVMDFDETRLQQIISNLLSNAIKFTPKGGSIRLLTQKKENNLEICVSDTGVGISEEDQQRIFDRFFQTESGRSNQNSSGIGLALTRELVELAGEAYRCIQRKAREVPFASGYPSGKELPPPN